MKKLILILTTMAMLSTSSSEAMNAGGGYVHSQCMIYEPTTWAIAFWILVGAGLAVAVLTSGSSNSHSH